MGQYYFICNVDKQEYLHPHRFGEGIKLLEFGSNGGGVLCGLAILLALGNGRGGGDLRSESPVIGSWVGDRVIVAGDYSDPWLDPQDLLAEEGSVKDNLYHLAGAAYKDISGEVLAALLDDEWLKEGLQARVGHYSREKLPLPYGERDKETKSIYQPKV